MGVRPDGTRDPTASTSGGTRRARATAGAATPALGGLKPTSNAGRRCRPARARDTSIARQPAKLASPGPCATWDPYDNTDPPGCDWFDPPARAEVMRRAGRWSRPPCSSRQRAAGARTRARASCGGWASPASSDPPTFRATGSCGARWRTARCGGSRSRRRTCACVDAGGKRVGGVATFLNGYLHGLYPPTRHPASGLPAEEQRGSGSWPGSIPASAPRWSSPGA